MTEPSAELVELMAVAAYEASRPNGSSRPPWAECTDHWRDAGRREISAALRAAERAGYRIEKA